MPNPVIANYIKQNLKSGFDKGEIREALFQAGWTENEIAGAFENISKSRSGLYRALLILAVTPLLGFGSAWLYSNYETGEPSDTGQVQGAVTTENTGETARRDNERIEGIRSIQQALETYFLRHQLYPVKLSELVSEGLLPSLPIDPKTKESYLYNPLGDPPLYYSLSVIFETNTDSHPEGFYNFSSESRL